MVCMNIDLSRNGDGIKVSAHILFEKPFAGEFSFLLSQTMKIESISDIMGEYKFGVYDAKEPFRKADKIFLTIPYEVSEIWIKYSGHPSGWHTSVTGSIFAVNYYSAWYPDDISAGCRDVCVKFHDSYYTHMVHAKRNTVENVWEYKPKDFDCNILAYKNAKLIQSDMLELLYLGDNDEETKAYQEVYTAAVNFCLNLFGRNPVSKCTLAILPSGNARDGYCREGLIRPLAKLSHRIFFA